MIFRIPTLLFGAGLIEQIPDRAIVDNLNNPVNQTEKRRMHVVGRVNVIVSGNTRTEQVRSQGEPNRNGNDGTIARFGWKAASLLVQEATRRKRTRHSSSGSELSARRHEDQRGFGVRKGYGFCTTAPPAPRSTRLYYTGPNSSCPPPATRRARYRQQSVNIRLLS